MHIYYSSPRPNKVHVLLQEHTCVHVYSSLISQLQFFRLSLGTMGEIQHESKTNNPFMQVPVYKLPSNREIHVD